MAERKKRSIAGDKTLCLPIETDMEYDTLVEATKAFRAYLDKLILTHPELFPVVEAGLFYTVLKSGFGQLDNLIELEVFSPIF